MSDSEKDLARKFFTEQDRLRGGPADELCGDGYTAYLASFPAMDLDGHKAFASAFYAGFSDLHHTIEDVVGEGDRVAVRMRLSGTHDGEFMGLPPSGRPIDVPALAVFTIASGKIVEVHGQFDQAGVMQQLGASGTG